jgi:hypothetical protein
VSRAEEIDAQLRANREAQDSLRRTERALVEERSALVTDTDRAEMKRRGHYTHTWKVTRQWAAAHVCPFCLTQCASSQQGKEFPNEQNAEYRCGNVEAIK